MKSYIKMCGDFSAEQLLDFVRTFERKDYINLNSVGMSHLLMAQVISGEGELEVECRRRADALFNDIFGGFEETPHVKKYKEVVEFFRNGTVRIEKINGKEKIVPREYKECCFEALGYIMDLFQHREFLQHIINISKL